ncbi:hypothetical protein ACFO3J_01180 [Streptomyces polygonati]|uniref:Uncharacterized protein n=1 Tax=Streptomyces polygonati TaxID=1617087 RepID=A0ABV8HDD5_9ACTN
MTDLDHLLLALVCAQSLLRLSDAVALWLTLRGRAELARATAVASREQAGRGGHAEVPAAQRLRKSSVKEENRG